MTATDLDPRWTERAPTMRILDPLGVESIEGSLQNRLLRPVLSIAITQRLRYLSYWAWVTANTDRHTQVRRPLYEKPLLLASLQHDCSDEGTGTSGIMGGTDSLEAKLEDQSTEAIDIAADAFTITSDDIARFDAYYKGIAYRLLLFENECILTPLGERLAAAYETATDVDFPSIQQAVDNESLPRAVLDQLAAGGCLCQLTDTERDLLTRAYWHLVTPTDHYEELAFGPEPAPEALRLEPYLDTTPDEGDSTALIEATIAGADETTDADYSEDLELFFTGGRDRFVRGSLVLLLALGDWVRHRQPPGPDCDALAESRVVWRLLGYTEYASHAIQALFISMQEAVQELEPVTSDELLQSVFGHASFDAAAGRALAGLEVTVDDAERSILEGVRDAVYFGTAPEGPVQVTATSDQPVSGTWDDVVMSLTDREPASAPFELNGHSERAYRTLIDDALTAPPGLEKARRVAGYSAVQLARIASRERQFFGADQQVPYVNWLQTAHEDPGPLTCWRIGEADADPTGRVPSADEWTTSAFARRIAAFTRRWTLTHYFERLYEKIRDGNGKSPQLLQLDTDGRLTFDRHGNSGAVYNGGVPNAPTAKFDRLGDIFYELGLITDASLSTMRVTDRGRELITAFTEDEA